MINKIKKFKISILFSILVFSLVIFGKGINGGGLDIINNLGFTVIYSIPIFLIEEQARIMTERKYHFLQIIKHSLRISSVSTVLWVLAFDFLFYHPQSWENGFLMGMMGVFGFMYVWPIFLITDIILFFVIIAINRLSSKVGFNIFILIFAGILFSWGIGSMARCDFAGCKNPIYRAQQAERENNPSYCGMNNSWDPNDIIYMFIPTYSYRDNKEECYMILANSTNDIKVCSWMPNKLEIILCYKKIASNLSDTSICDKMLVVVEEKEYDRLGKIDKGECYGQIAIKTGDYSLCETAGFARNDCYFKIAYKTRNETICDKISFEIGKNNCLENLHYKIKGSYTPMRIGLPEEDPNY